MNDNIIYISPYENQNEFIEILKKIFSNMGYHVKDMEILTSVKSNAKTGEIAVINWLEDSPCYEKNFLKSVITFGRAVKKAILLKKRTKKVFWIKHNYRPHDRNLGQLFSQILTWLFTRLDFHVLVLESTFDGDLILHPLYMADERALEISKEFSLSKNRKADKVLFFGAIKQYKNLHVALNTWPQNLPLLIAGKCNDNAYFDKLVKIVNDRKLNVTLKNIFLTKEDLEALLLEYSYILMPHQDKTIISSGTFYHAISFGCKIITLPSSFSKHKAAQHKFVLVNEDFTNLGTEIELNKISRSEVIRDAVEKYGRVECMKVWEKKFDSK
ncbi:hypothetical protein KL866_14470 [Alteromonas sp. ALT199]|uniref:hypothetical protein n=1 Tax=unclassified Alteromonas TaxID=2614992 RepID=UPI001BEBE8E2|nr:hypothetical protein [Alteromonas sp. ALT199]MBT3136280.1 hypothetical protein [Alteromonas sp. ALT199]